MISGDQGGGLAWLLRKERGRQLRSRTGQQQRWSRSLPEIRGGRNNEYNANINTTMRDVTMSGARCALTWYEVVPVKGGNIQESIPGVPCFRAEEPEGKSCGFDRLEGCGGRTGCVSGFVSSF